MTATEVNLNRTMAPDAEHPGPGGRRHTFADLYHERTNYQFIDRSWRWAVLSGTLVLIALAALGLRGLNLGIDFKGGTQWTVTVEGKSANTADVRNALSGAGQNDAKVLILGNTGLRVQTKELSPAERTKVTNALAKYANTAESKVSVTNVGPTWGNRVSKKALQALIVFFIAIALYLSLRFEWRMALAAIVAVVHDIIITAGVYAITQFEVTPATVVAFLTILGFSLYDTVVVFDKVKENEDHLGHVKNDTYSMMVNRSLNQVLMRSLNTSFVAVLPVLSLLVVGRFALGAVGLQDFALALFVGLLTGAYSSIYVATPIVAWLKEREPKYRAVRERSRAQLMRDESAPRPAAAPTPKPASPRAPKPAPVAVAVAEPEPEPEAAPAGEAGREPEPARDEVPEPEREEPLVGPEPPAAAPTPRPRSTGPAPRPRQQRGGRRKKR